MTSNNPVVDAEARIGNTTTNQKPALAKLNNQLSRIGWRRRRRWRISGRVGVSVMPPTMWDDIGCSWQSSTSAHVLLKTWHAMASCWEEAHPGFGQSVCALGLMCLRGLSLFCGLILFLFVLRCFQKQLHVYILRVLPISRNDHTTVTAPLPVCSAKLSTVGPG